jgi:polysaccharide transporter, PST family
MTPRAFFEDHRALASLGRQSLRAGAMSMTARTVNALVQLGSVICLARLLSPEDYGLVTMVLAISGFAPMVVDLGTRDAIVQRTRITEGEISTLFWITVSLAIGLACLVAGGGPLIAWIYHEPRLTRIAVVCSLNVVAAGLYCQHMALLRRAMMFREMAWIELGGAAVGAAVAVGVAYLGFGYWALVIRPMATALATAIGMWVVCPWIPSRPVLTAEVRQMLRFGVNLIGFTMSDFVARNGDRVAIGYRFGPEGLGLYQKALLFYENLLDVLTNPLHGVAVASLSRLRDDVVGLRRAWAKALSVLAFWGMPAFGLMAVTGQDVIVLLLGEKWSGAGLLLSILALRGIPHVVERSLGWLHVTAGRADRWARWGVFASCAQLGAIVIGLWFGLAGVVIASAICTAVLSIPAIAYAGRPLGIRFVDVVKAVGPQMIGALTAVGLCHAIGALSLAEAPRVVRIASLGGSYVISYFVVVVWLFGVRTPVDVVTSLIGDVLSKRAATSQA